jgi:hypothetical protein
MNGRDAVAAGSAAAAAAAGYQLADGRLSASGLGRRCLH